MGKNPDIVNLYVPVDMWVIDQNTTKTWLENMISAYGVRLRKKSNLAKERSP